MEERNDGLLRGSRVQRAADMFSLKDAAWNLDTLLDLHIGFLDHAEEVRLAAVESLQEIARKVPAPMTLTPLGFLVRYMLSFTAASGAARRIFEFLIELSTPEALRLATRVLEGPSSNEEFKAFVGILSQHRKLELLRQVPEGRLGKAKRAVLQRALDAA